MKTGQLFATAAFAALCLATASNAQSIEDRLANADAAAGEKLFRQCQACHTIDKGGADRSGPNLYGVVGRDVAAVSDFRYSSAMADHGGTWTPEALDAFLENPRQSVPRTRMTFRGLSEPQERADMIAYLNTQSDTPLEFAAASGEAAAAGEEETAEEDFGQLVVAEGAEETYYTCTACHSEMIIAQQGKTRDGWDEMLDWMIEEQGMPELAAEERETILDYLSTHYNTDRPNFPRP